MATDGGGGVVYGSNNWLSLSRLGKHLVSVLQYFTSDLRTIVQRNVAPHNMPIKVTQNEALA